jgi:tRNA nucleotidyltransferase (CCA-adding enzyme)
MQVYEVGGAVRDALLGAPVTDRDWVVVGATPQQMVEAGYRPVGRDFPVFLHPETQEEYALARTERKSGPGYRGFTVHAAPDVTLEQDLSRRDLTINAMARAADGTVIDPYGGLRDLAAGILRHVSPAFAEDPVRLLRLARFAARWPDFRVADETMTLLRDLVRAGEVDALVPERVWQELARGLGETRPSRMLDVLRTCGALARLLPEVDAHWGPDTDPGPTGRVLREALDEAARRRAPRTVRFALLACGPLLASSTPANLAAERVDALAARWRVPNDERELALLVARAAPEVARADALDAAGLVHLLDLGDAWRRPERFDQALLALECAWMAAAHDAPTHGSASAARRAEPDASTSGARPALRSLDRVRSAWALARSVDARAVTARAVARGQEGAAIAQALFAARRDAIDTGSAPG